MTHTNSKNKMGSRGLMQPVIKQLFPFTHAFGTLANMTHSSHEPDSETEGLTLTKPKPKVTRPSLYKVFLLNDDFTPMDFVVLVLKKFFSKSETEASQIMMEVHHKGSGLAGVFTFEVAETKSYLVNEFAKGHRHPLHCIIEKEEGLNA